MFYDDLNHHDQIEIEMWIRVNDNSPYRIEMFLINSPFQELFKSYTTIETKIKGAYDEYLVFTPFKKMEFYMKYLERNFIAQAQDCECEIYYQLKRSERKLVKNPKTALRKLNLLF